MRQQLLLAVTFLLDFTAGTLHSIGALKSLTAIAYAMVGITAYRCDRAAVTFIVAHIAQLVGSRRVTAIAKGPSVGMLQG